MSSENTRKKLLLIVNPVSGKKAIVRKLTEVIQIFQDAGYLCTVTVTGHKGGATEIVREQSALHDITVCTGGDGTLNEVVTGFAQEGICPPVGYIPCGSVNDFAATHGLSMDIAEAARRIANGTEHPVDLGRFGEEYFTYVAAFGAFSAVSYSTDQNLKNLLGKTAYLVDGAASIGKIHPVHMKVTADGVIYEDDYIFGCVCNSRSVGGGVVKLPENMFSTDDGKMELVLIRNPNNAVVLNEELNSLIMQNYSGENLRILHCENVLFENPDHTYFSLDGERGASNGDIAVSVLKGFIRLVC